MTLLPALPGWWPWALLGAVAVGIVLLYFLKLRREPVEVPSTFLWTRTIEDLHVNRLLQRLRTSVLLLLQLLILAAIALALLRPGYRGDAGLDSRMVWLLDHSASMNAPSGGGDDRGVNPTPLGSRQNRHRRGDRRDDRPANRDAGLLQRPCRSPASVHERSKPAARGARRGAADQPQHRRCRGAAGPPTGWPIRVAPARRATSTTFKSPKRCPRRCICIPTVGSTRSPSSTSATWSRPITPSAPTR